MPGTGESLGGQWRRSSPSLSWRSRVQRSGCGLTEPDSSTGRESVSSPCPKCAGCPGRGSPGLAGLLPPGLPRPGAPAGRTPGDEGRRPVVHDRHRPRCAPSWPAGGTSRRVTRTPSTRESSASFAMVACARSQVERAAKTRTRRANDGAGASPERWRTVRGTLTAAELERACAMLAVRLDRARRTYWQAAGVFPHPEVRWLSRPGHQGGTRGYYHEDAPLLAALVDYALRRDHPEADPLALLDAGHS